MTDDPSMTLTGKNQQLVLPITDADFREFIARLLGKPQTISNMYDGPFDLKKEDIENCFHVVDQRVRQQNKASLVQFSVMIAYDDNSSVLLNSLQDFQTYRELRPIISTRAHLSWTYLIKFEGREVPEKQVIDLVIATRRRLGRGQSPEFLLHDKSGKFYLSIEHTARTWGGDIENLLGGQLRLWKRHEPWYKRLIYNNTGWVGLGAGLLFLACVIYGLVAAATPRIVAERASALKALSGETGEKLDFLIRRSVEFPELNLHLLSSGIVLASLAASLVIGIGVGFLSENPPASYLVLSESARKAREEALRDTKWSWGYFIGSAIAATVAGVLSRYIFAAVFGTGG